MFKGHAILVTGGLIDGSNKIVEALYANGSRLCYLPELERYVHTIGKRILKLDYYY